jgi:hypothetical protein
MGIHKSLLDDAQADDDTRITACEGDISACLSAIAAMQADITAMMGQLSALMSGKADVAGQVFTGSISAPNLSGTNTGNQIAGAPTVTYTTTSLAPIGGVVILGITVVDAATMNARMATIEAKLNNLGDDDSSIRGTLQSATPSPLMA